MEHKGTPRAAVFVDTGVSPPSSFLLPTSPYPDLILLMSASDLQAGWRLRPSMHKDSRVNFGIDSIFSAARRARIENDQYTPQPCLARLPPHYYRSTA